MRANDIINEVVVARLEGIAGNAIASGLGVETQGHRLDPAHSALAAAAVLIAVVTALCARRSVR